MLDNDAVEWMLNVWLPGPQLSRKFWCLETDCLLFFFVLVLLIKFCLENDSCLVSCGMYILLLKKKYNFTVP